MYSNITSSLRFLPMDLSGSFDGENSWENRSKKKKTLLHGQKGVARLIRRIKKNTENYPRKYFWVYPADIAIHLLNNWGTDTSVESAERNKRDTRRPESARVTRASCSTTASSLLRVSPSRAPVLSFATTSKRYSDLTWNASYRLGVRCREERTFFEWWTSTGSEFFAFLVSGFALIF